MRKQTASEREEKQRLCVLHDRWGAHVDEMIADGSDAAEVVEAMLTIAAASMIKVAGIERTAHALLFAYGSIREDVMKDAQPTMRPN